MIVTFAQQKGGVGKTTLAIAFANYLTLHHKKTVKVYDFDYQKSFYNRWKEDEILPHPQLYEVEVLEDNTEKVDKVLEINNLMEMNQSEEVFIFDLAGTLNASYSDLLVYSNFLVIPIEYSDVTIKSTMEFISLLGMLDSQAIRVFLRSKYDKGYLYKNQKDTDEILSDYGLLLPTPVYKRNDLQSINTRKLPYNQLLSIKQTFEELIQYIHENL